MPSDHGFEVLFLFCDCKLTAFAFSQTSSLTVLFLSLLRSCPFLTFEKVSFTPDNIIQVFDFSLYRRGAAIGQGGQIRYAVSEYVKYFSGQIGIVR